ncbi:MAG: FGGY family carbohydrate kinase [Sulfolobales archaeon]|nr:FGGY family carbohydrate kinase [Sulfolobales archaeon]
MDLGTTHVKGALLNFDDKKEVLSVVRSLSYRIEPVRPEPLAYEHDPREILKLVKIIIKEICSGVSIDSIVLTSYLFGVFLANERFEPLTNIYTWVDERSYEVLIELKPFSKELYGRTGCPHLHVYALPKLLWLKRRSPNLLRDARHFMDSKSLLMHFLTGHSVTDLSSASGTYQMLNIRSLRWDDFALEIAGIDENYLPEVRESYITEPMKTELAHELGISKAVPVVLGVYDGGSMIYGLTGGSTGLGVINMGSSAMMRAVISEPIIDSHSSMRFQTYYLMENTWLAGGAISNGGVVVEHIIRLLYNVPPDDVSTYAEVLNSLGKLRKTPQTLITVPILLSERLPLNPARRVSIVGIDSSTRREDIVLSTIEGIVMLLSLLYKAMEENGVVVDEIRIGGKLTEYLFVRKLVANILGKKVVYRGFGDVSHLGNLFLFLKAMKYMGSNEIVRLCINMLQDAERINPESSDFIKYRNLLEVFEELINKLYI